MSEETIKKALKDFGMTETETEVYLLLAKTNPLKGTEVARQLNKDKGQVYQILKSLQGKGFVESTLEAPARFTPVPFENVLESAIKAKKDETARIESAKQELLIYWKSLNKAKIEVPVEKFLVIEGRQKVYSRISQLMKDAQNQLSVIMTIPDFLRTDKFGVFDAVLPSKSSIQVRFLTELNEKNTGAMKKYLREIPETKHNFRSRVLDLGLPLSPRMIVKDNDEVLLFTTPKTGNVWNNHSVEACLWTNCRPIVEAFTRVFEELWSTSTDIYRKLAEVEIGGIPPVHYLYNPEKVMKTYEEALANAKEEISILTSSEGLIELWKNSESLIELTKRDLSVRIMAPIVSENLAAFRGLSESCSIRHVSESSFTTIVVDGRHLFQFRNPKYPKRTSEPLSTFETLAYTDEFEYAQKAKSILNNVWRNAQVLSNVSPESKTSHDPEINLVPEVFDISDRFRSVLRLEERTLRTVTEKDIVNKIITAKRVTAKNPLKDMNIQYGSSARAVIHPPSYLSLPDMKIEVCHWNKQSSWGAEDWLTLYLWLETSRDYAYVPVAHVTDNPKPVDFRKGVFAGTPAEQNVIKATKSSLQVRVQGNTLFAGWTMPIPLYPSQYLLPPCCVLFEGHGQLKTGTSVTSLPSGKMQIHEYNSFDAFVTLFHPSSKYSGSGIDGSFNREHIMTAYPPKQNKNSFPANPVAS